MDYKISMTEPKVRFFLNACGWELIDPGCTTLHRGGTTTYEPPEYCYLIEDNKVKCKVIDLIEEMIEFALGVVYVND